VIVILLPRIAARNLGRSMDKEGQFKPTAVVSHTRPRISCHLDQNRNASTNSLSAVSLLPAQTWI
jgi:hypothetical protein